MGKAKVMRMTSVAPTIMQFDSLSFSTPNGKQVICAGQDLTLSEGKKMRLDTTTQFDGQQAHTIPSQ